MSDYLPFLVVGLTAGSVYGLAGVGLVLTYKTSGIFNFAHGAVATTAAYAFYFLHVEHHLAWPLALVLSVAVLGPLLGCLLELLARRIASVTIVWQVVATVGIILATVGFFNAQYGQEAALFPAFLPTSNAFTVSSVVVSWDQVIITLTALVATVGLFLFFRLSLTGLAMRGVVDNSELLDIGGTSPVKVRRASWMVGASFAALAGVLLAPSLNLNALLLTLLVIQAFGAAAVGYFSSLPLTYVGGLVTGIIAALVTKEVAAHPDQNWLNGVPASMPFVILFIVLLVTPRRRLVERRFVRQIPKERYRAPGSVQLAGGVVVLAVLAAVPALISHAQLSVYTDGLTKIILFLSLGLLVRTSGQVSLCQMTFAAVGAISFSHLITDVHLPWLLALLLGGLIAVPVGAVVAIPAIRLSGVFLALATLGFGLAVEQIAYPLSFMFGLNLGGSPTPRPAIPGFQGDTGYYYLVLIFVVLFALVVVALNRGRLGRLLRAMADSPVATTTNGVSINTTKVTVFCISAFMAAISGGLYGASITTVTSGQFSAFTSLTLVATLVIVWGGEPWYAILAAAALTVIPSYISGETVTDWLNVVFGLSAIALAVQNGNHTPAWFKRLVDRLGDRLATAIRRRVPARPEPAAAVPSAAAPAVRPTVGLAVDGVTIRFGGNVAVRDISLEAPPGRITGLIGPNGAGKTSTFNVCSGLVHQESGEVFVEGTPLRRTSPAARACMGLGRTFQRTELLDSLTVRENVALGAEASMAADKPWRHIVARRGDNGNVSSSVAAALDLCGISHLTDTPAGDLSTGQRRLVELARCLAGPYNILLLDEPSSGLDAGETRAFGQLLQQVVAEREVAILLVEHDMSLVMSICDFIYVLDFGAQIFEGSPDEVATSDAVRLAYLGAEPLGSDGSAALVSDTAANGRGS